MARTHPITTSQPPIPRNTPGNISLTPIATPTHGAGGAFSIISALRIAAPPDDVFAAVLEHSAWPAWNRFVRRVTIVSAPPPSPSPSASALEAAMASDDGSRYIKKGTKMTFEVHLDPDDAHKSTSQGMEVTLLEPFDTAAAAADADAAGEQSGRRGWRVAWTGTSMPGLLLRTERVQEFVDDGEGGTEYTCWETMYGPLAPVVRWTTGKSLEKGFEAWGVDLKARAETLAKDGGLNS
ncbi:unnamed protein product [Discula destructiva]